MSETNKKTKNNPAIACGDMKLEGEQIILDQANYGPSKNEINALAGIEIKMEDSTVINMPDGRIALQSTVTGKIIGYLDGDGTIRRKLDAKGKEAKKEEEGQEI